MQGACGQSLAGELRVCVPLIRPKIILGKNLNVETMGGGLFSMLGSFSGLGVVVWGSVLRKTLRLCLASETVTGSLSWMPRVEEGGTRGAGMRVLKPVRAPHEPTQSRDTAWRQPPGPHDKPQRACP